MEQLAKEVTLNEVATFLKTQDDFLILTHVNPDGDTLGSGFALCMLLQQMGKKAGVICADDIPKKYGYFVDDVPFTASKTPAVIIAVDVADRNLFGKLDELYGSRVNLCIDHHVSNSKYAEKLYLDPKAAATCECVFDIAKTLGQPLSKQAALALYTGITTDTGCFKFSNTTPKTHRTAADLMELDIETSEINRVMFDTKTRTRIELERIALDGIEFYYDGLCSVVTVTRDIYDKTGCKDDDLEGLTALSSSIEGVVVGITLRERPDGSFKASVRTYPPIDAAKLCSNMGGGGHVRAAGCQLSGPLESAKKEILVHVRKALETADARASAN